MSSGRHALPSRFGKLYREIAKFGMVGASGFVVNLAVFNLNDKPATLEAPWNTLGLDSGKLAARELWDGHRLPASDR